MRFRYFHFYSFDNDDMKSSKRHVILLSLIFLLKCFSKSFLFKLFPWERLFLLAWTAQYKLENFTWKESFDNLMLIWGALKFEASYLLV